MVAIGIILFLLAISAHEMGHALAMRKYGVKIRQISLLGFGPTLFSFKVKKLFGDVPIHIKAIPLGAFVEPENSDYEKQITDSQKIYIFGGGIVANIIYAAVFIGIAALLGFELNILVIACLVLGLVAAILPRFTCYLTIVLGIGMICLLILVILQDNPASIMDAHNSLSENSGSIVAITQSVIEFSTSWSNTFFFVGIVSLSLGLFQAMLFYPLDGGRIAKVLIEKISRKRRLPVKIFQIISGILLFYLVIIALGSDVVRIIDLF